VAAGDSGRLDFGVDSAGAGLTKTTALDYGADGIRVNVIIAGLVDTPLIAEGRSPETAQDVTVPAEAAAA
jgi:NAD(P)-dependent dehydrogenase (short-subunit alcohol dehydrogenase family)